MQGRSNDPPQQWSVHAQFTISHPGIDAPNIAPPQTHTERDENGVRMFYTWTSQPNTTSADTQETSITTCAPGASTTVTESNRQSLPAYGFQRGNLLFTSVPPRRPFGINEQVTGSNLPSRPLHIGTNIQDSGYNSELLSPNSFASGSLPRRTIQPYNRKCRSTCSIVLSTTINEQPELEETGESVTQQPHCGRTQSLRCQTPTAHSERSNSFYGCGDPWCHHSTYGDDVSVRFSPVQESEGSSSTAPTVIRRPFRSGSFTPRDFSNKTDLENKKNWGAENRVKDAAVQTFEMVDKCTSPFMKMDSFYFKDQETQDNLFKKEKTLKKRSSYNARSRTEPVFVRTHSPSSFTPDSLESQEPVKRLTRTPGKLYGKSPFLSDRKSSASDSKSSDPTKKPRTVHIDVYCTGTEQESDGSSSESDIESKTASSPQTVFESEKVRITHSRSDDKNLPMKIKEQVSSSSSKTDVKSLPIKEVELKPGVESDNDDNTSTAYPSQISSYSAIAGLSSFSSSVPPSWSTYSVDNDYDSLANTSWKDTFSDIDSLTRSRSSIAPTDSLDFIPRRILSSHKSESIEEQPEAETKSAETPSVVSLNPSDSFEYANSEDRLRIKRMEQMWNKPINQRHWKSPHLERKHLLQQQKLKEYVEKRLSGISLPKSESKDSDSGSDSSEKGWSFVKDDDKKLQRDITVRRASKDNEDKNIFKPESIKEEKQTVNEGNVSDLFSSRRSPALRSPSVVAVQEKISLNPNLRSPFMLVPGIFTEQRFVARKFGSVVDVFRKPGHHIGPAKNPECQCDHCRRFFENGGRGRARSVGEIPSTHPWANWKSSNRYSQPRDSREQSFADY